jgi:hypothetical protein
VGRIINDSGYHASVDEAREREHEAWKHRIKMVLRDHAGIVEALESAGIEPIGLMNLLEDLSRASKV